MTILTNPRDAQGNGQPSDAVERLLSHAYRIDWYTIAYVVILVIALFTRFYDLNSRVMSHDESLHTRYSYNLASEGNFQHTPLMHGPILFHINALFYYLFGANDFTSRLYSAILGVLLVMMPLLFRRWLGKWGALLASVMLLISPITMYYNRYMREDTPNLFYTVIMIYGVLMYLSGPEAQRRREHWLYIVAAAMLMGLGSKETAFIYIFIIGVYLALYWFVRLAHFYFRRVPPKTTFYTLIAAFSVGGVAALGMYVVLSVNLAEQPFFTAISTLANYQTFIVWTLAVVLAVVLTVAFSVWRGFSGSGKGLPILEGVGFFVLSLAISTVFIVAEELSRLSHDTTGTSEPVVPTNELGEIVTNINRVPIGLIWLIAIVVIGLLVLAWRRGLFRLMQENFPEFDLIVIIGGIILPWAAPLVIASTGASPTDYSRDGMILAAAALVPMIAISTTLGLLWNWRKWLISVGVFYALFAFFFTTMFTNPQGVATGIIGSLGYWLEQQGVRRGNQPQYYYLTIILPIYEFLPLIGGGLAAIAGLTGFWRFRSNRIVARAAEQEELQQEIADYMAASAPSPITPPAFTAVEEIPETINTADSVSLTVDVDNQTPTDDANTSIPAAAEMPKPEVSRTWLEAEALEELPFIPFVAWWGVFNLIAYTLAGEKMPWLAIHLSLPLILLTAWYFNAIFEQVNTQELRRVGWIYLILLPILFVLTARLLAPFVFEQALFSDLSTLGLGQTGIWLGNLAVTGTIVLVLALLATRHSWLHLRQMTAIAFFSFLGLLSFRTAWIASFVNYDLANEFLVYAHAAPAVKTVLNDIEDLSRRTTDGLELRFLYDNEVSWPYSWYFRDYPNAQFVGASANAQQVDSAMAVVIGDANRSKFEPLLEDRFYRYEYIRLWWPMQDYFNMTPQRVQNTFGAGGGTMRHALWDIWWNRDYDAYGEAVGRDFDLNRWPVADRMHFYVRKDFVAQIWDLGVGDAVAQNPLSVEETNVCNANWQPVGAERIFDQPLGGFSHPLDLAVGADGRVFVAEEFNQRISVFNANGAFETTFGVPGRVFDGTGAFMGHETTLGNLERPNGVALDAAGNLFVADTWNYRIQVFNAAGVAQRAWGQRGEFGAAAQAIPPDGLWGPRDVALDANSNVYVSDTGNKRIRVYDAQGNYLRDLGSAGSAEGQLNEPSGVVVHSDGRVFVADTWNRRVSVFNTDGNYLYSFRVRAWYNDLGNRPYLALDEARNYIYVTDPDAARVLVYDTNGGCVGSFGQAGNADGALAANQFQVAAGITTDSVGNVYISDSGAGRVLRYAPFTLPLGVQTEAQLRAENVQAEGLEEFGAFVDPQQLGEQSVPLELGGE